MWAKVVELFKKLIGNDIVERAFWTLVFTGAGLYVYIELPDDPYLALLIPIFASAVKNYAKQKMEASRVGLSREELLKVQNAAKTLLRSTQQVDVTEESVVIGAKPEPVVVETVVEKIVEVPVEKPTPRRRANGPRKNTRGKTPPA